METPGDLWLYRAKFTRAIDGDTIEVLVDLGMRVSTTVRIRVADINAPELRGPEKAQGKLARDWVQDFLGSEEWVLVRTRKDRRSFNRYVGDVWRTSDGAHLSTETVRAGHAVWA